MERNKEFLCSELKVVSAKEAEDRIFFVSAKETLHQRLTESGAVTTPCECLLVVIFTSLVCDWLVGC